MKSGLFGVATFVGVLLVSASAFAASPAPELVPAGEFASSGTVASTTALPSFQFDSTAVASPDQVLCVGVPTIGAVNEPHYQIAVYQVVVTCEESVTSLDVTATLQRSGTKSGTYSDVEAASVKCDDTSACVAGATYDVTGPDWYRTHGDACSNTCDENNSAPEYFDGTGDVVSSLNSAVSMGR